MDIVIKVLQLILCLSLLVLVHELGHFLFAKLFKVRVNKFYLFFNPWFSLVKFKIGETEYGIGWIPFGGYVSIAGMIDESMDTEQMKEPPKPYELRSKPAWQRLLIMLGGVMMNVLLAFIIYAGISYKYGEQYIHNADARYGYQFSVLAQEMGFRNGDRIISIDGIAPDNYRNIPTALIFDNVQYVEIERDGQQMKIRMDERFIPRLLKETAFLELRIPLVVSEVVPGGGAEKAGILPGDSLISANGEKLFTDQYAEIFSAFKGDTVRIEVGRDSAGITIHKTFPVLVSDSAKIGVVADISGKFSDFYPLTTHRYTFWESIPQGIKGTGAMLGNYVKQLKLIISPKTEAYKSVGSIISIGNVFPAHWDWLAFWHITALISIMLAVVNLLPIPGLDGGHVLFVLYEMITRRKPSDKFMEYAQMVGMFLLICIMVLALGNDIYRLFK